MDILTYAKLYKQFVTTENCDEELLDAMRDHLIEEGAKKRLVAVEKTVDYESFGGSEELMNFINCTKTLLIKPNHANYEAWRSANPMSIEKRGLENLTAAMIVTYTMNYLEEVL